MNTLRDRDFPRRLDENGNYHSICLNCFQTVATSYSDEVLVKAEAKHVCKTPLWSDMPNRPVPVSSTSRWPMER